MANNKIGVETVNRDEFNFKMYNYFNSHSKSKNSLWSLNQERFVIQILTEIESGVKKTSKHYHFANLYELLRISGEVFVVLKRKKIDDPLIYLVPFENIYDKLLEAHIQTGHGGRDRMHYYVKKKWVISKNSCAIFAAICQTCNRKRAAPVKNVVVKLILSDGFNVRGQVDLVDLQSCPHGECHRCNSRCHPN